MFLENGVNLFPKKLLPILCARPLDYQRSREQEEHSKADFHKRNLRRLIEKDARFHGWNVGFIRQNGPS